MASVLKQGGLIIWMVLVLGCMVDIGCGLEFPGTESQWTRFPKWNACCESEMSFNMKTKRSSGLVVYFDDEGFCDFLELILYEGRLKLSFSIFCAEPASLLTDLAVNDNKWHSVVIKRNFKNTTLILDKESKWVEVKSKRRDMTVFSSLFIGGIPPELHSTLKLTFPEVKDHSPFQGWIRNVRVNFSDSSPVTSNDIRMEDETDPCAQDQVCLNGGICSVVKEEATCDCSQTGFQGKDCSEGKTISLLSSQM
ncbi:hypothetical protein XELAEV_18028784mg [Xenopus laevis]|uniref:EGF-like domain-containing protein n=1 Tax=Xenopus laevis TaxID=8355 RepID=A0A974HH36_XENLA|nr:hypothetical protein XELAEV_18028784mg [Xenopus laevis]